MPDFNPQRSSAVFTVASNLTLVLVSVGILFTSNYFYKTNIEANTVSENRFITMEWHLLQNLKTETDDQLSEKDREIAELKQKYKDSKLQNVSKELLAEMNAKLKKAEMERAAILTRNFASKITPEPLSSIRSNENKTIASAFATETTDLFSKRIEALEIQLQESLQNNQKMEAELARQIQINSLNHIIPTETSNKDIVDTSSTSKKAVYREILNILNILDQQKLDETTQPPLEDIKTRALLRAIVRSPDIRSSYPTLSESLDRYFEFFAYQEQLKGKKNAYDEMIKALNKNLP